MSLCSRQHTRTALTSSPHLLPHKQRSTRHLQPWANVPSVVPRSISKRRRQAAESQMAGTNHWKFGTSKFALLLLSRHCKFNLPDFVSAFLTANFVSDDSLILAWGLRRPNKLQIWECRSRNGVAFHAKSRLNAGEGECERTSCGINKFWSSRLLLWHRGSGTQWLIRMENLESQSKTFKNHINHIVDLWRYLRILWRYPKDVSWLRSWATSAVQMGFSPTRDQAPEPLTLTARISSTSDGAAQSYHVLSNLNEFKRI